jgi:hypothetical protein
MDTISKLSRKELIRGLPSHKLKLEGLCDACERGKHTKSSSFKSKTVVSTKRPLELIHLDLCGPMSVSSLAGKRYCFVIVDDYSRFSWVYYLIHKNETCDIFIKFCSLVENEQSTTIITVRSDNGGEFKNTKFDDFCSKRGYKREFSAPRTPQQNGVVERKNRTLIELARTMLNEHPSPKFLWAEAVNTACHVVNRVSLRSILNKTPYELWYGRRPNISYMKIFGCKCFILNESDKRDKLDPKSNEGVFVGYSNSSKAYRVYIKSSRVIVESVHVHFDETNKGAENGIPIIDSNNNDDGMERQQQNTINPNVIDPTHENIDNNTSMENHDGDNSTQQPQDPTQVDNSQIEQPEPEPIIKYRKF